MANPWEHGDAKPTGPIPARGGGKAGRAARSSEFPLGGDGTIGRGTDSLFGYPTQKERTVTNTLQAIRAKRASRDEGFTLIELMVVVLIIAILLLIAIPTFIGARNRAQDRSAQSNVRNALTNAKGIYTDNEDYQDADTTALAAAEPSLTFVAGGVNSTAPKEVSVASPSATRVVLVVRSNTGTCFAMQDQVGAGGPGTEYATVSGACNAGNAPAAADAAWGDKW